MILSQSYDAKKEGSSKVVQTGLNVVLDTYCSVRSATTNFIMLNANDRSRDSESIEGISGPEELEDEVFLGYFSVDYDGNKRPIPAPRQLIRMPAVDQGMTGTAVLE